MTENSVHQPLLRWCPWYRPGGTVTNAVWLAASMPLWHHWCMELRHLRYLVAAVEEGSFRGASERTHVAQPALSRRIRDLEDTLGCQLLERTPRGVTATPAGMIMYREAVTLLDGLARVTEQLRSLGREQGREVRLGLVHMFNKYSFLNAGIGAFSASLKKANLSFIRELSPELVRALREGRLDVTLLYGHSLGQSGSFGERVIHEERYILAVHPEHRLADGGALSLSELLGEPLVWLSRPGFGESRDILMQRCRLQGLEPQIRYFAESHDEQMELTIASKGVCITPASNRISTSSSVLVFRPFSDFHYALRLSMAWVPHTEESDAAMLLRCLHAAIDQHQADIVAGRASWAVIGNYPIIVVPDPHG